MSERVTSIAIEGGPRPLDAPNLPGLPTVWRLFETPATDGARNMATDMALVDSVRDGGQPIVRFYRWWPPCISLGRNQPARGRYDVAEAERRGIEFVRRPTGGRAVYHHHEITYSVIVRERQLGGPRRTYQVIHKSLLAGLRLLGAATELVGDSVRALPPSTLPCFSEIDRGAIVAGNRKLVGSAQCREAGVLLQHGSLLLSGDQSPTWELLTVRGEGEGRTRLTALDEVLSYRPTWGELVDGLASGFERLLGIQFTQSVLDAEERARVTRHARHFTDPEWTWRR